MKRRVMHLPKFYNSSDTKMVAYWLYLMAILVGMMVIIGGITRLTGSGLSMAEWRPLIGTLPPLNNAEWMRIFELYKSTPEYQQLNFGMQMGEFKQIFFWEYFHRLWGRLLGLVYMLQTDGPIGGRVCMCNTASHGAAIANGAAGNATGHSIQHPVRRIGYAAVFNRRMGYAGSD